MSPEPLSDVHWLCPSCDAEPPPGLREPVCPTCGARLIEVRTRAKDITGLVIDGRFEIRDLIGEGGMGAVYRAWQRSIGREVAIKLIDERHGRDPMAVRRFLREARLASQLSQPNTVSVIDFGQSSDGRLFIAMELIRGRTLAEVLETDGPFPVSRAAWIGVQLCDALDAAHRLKIVHRDLKPANVVLLDDPPGRDLIKVLDFGLAKSLTESESKATDTGLVVGTPRYMAPEVVMGEPPTPQSDLYAVGVILGELSTGKYLWEATSFPALVGQKMHVSPVIQDVPAGLRFVVARLIDPELSRRPPTASDLRGLLRPLVSGTETPVPFTGPARALDDAAPVSGPRFAGPRSPAAPTVPTVAIMAATPVAAEEPQRSAESPSASTSAVTVATPTPAPRPLAIRPTTTAAVDSLIAPAVNDAGRRRGWTVAAVTVAVMIAIVVGAIVIGRGRDQVTGGAPPAPLAVTDAATSPPPLNDAAAATPPIDAAPVRTVTLTVRSKPAGAAVFVDGQPAGVAPIEVAWPAGVRAVTIEVRHGGRSARQTVVPDRDRTLTLVVRRAVDGSGGGSELPF